MNIAYYPCLFMVFRDIWSNLYRSSVNEQYYIWVYLPRVSKSIECIRDSGQNVHWCFWLFSLARCFQTIFHIDVALGCGICRVLFDVGFLVNPNWAISVLKSCFRWVYLLIKQDGWMRYILLEFRTSTQMVLLGLGCGSNQMDKA